MKLMMDDKKSTMSIYVMASNVATDMEVMKLFTLRLCNCMRLLPIFISRVYKIP